LALRWLCSLRQSGTLLLIAAQISRFARNLSSSKKSSTLLPQAQYTWARNSMRIGGYAAVYVGGV
jgi:hypothetical protein